MTGDAVDMLVLDEMLVLEILKGDMVLELVPVLLIVLVLVVVPDGMLE